MDQPTPKQNDLGGNEKNVRPFGIRDKFGYLLGDFGNDFSFILVSAFLMVFYTDVFGISAAQVGTLFLVARLWDSVTDVFWGRFIDSRKQTKIGKFKPWIFRMSIPLVISSALMFVQIPGMSNGFYLAYAYVTYILWGMLYTSVNIPYGSMASVISGDAVDRTALSTWRTMGAMLASLIINVLGPLLIFVDNQIDPNRMLMTAIVFSILAFACYMGCVRLSTERIKLQEKQEGEKGDLGATAKGLVKNKPLITILIASLLFMMNMLLIGAINIYLFKDYFGNTTALSIIGFIQTAAVFVAIPLLKPLVARFGKKEVASGGMLLASTFYFILYFMSNVSVTLFLVFSAIAMFGFGFFNLVVWAFVTDVIDYHEYLTGLREDGTVYAVYSFARKVGQALAGGLGGFAIAAVGYQAGIDTQQPQEVLNGIYTLATLIPAIIYLVIFLILVFLYPLNKKRVSQLASDISEIRNKK
ncbi:MFS transporter [Bacillus sp. V3B]|nr:glycoside-pentoside-hexuronide (GPH):cation symporter [Bacillus sp. V3B]MCQ6275663.1 MFS transporter [Bacillus sp. V3B]